ncbi:hypothetical protein AURDEDRAFT_164976 [Auricularia subglabra TFB-10046 SS5]|nr:hypothetical protein AURDEDRAFT_164976 [Auricularia subglabra TFB-10046 SS5]
MPVAAFAFGSFGDIVSVLHLLWQLRAALNDATGASAELTTLTSDIDEFSRAMLEVKGVLERRSAELQPGVVNGVAFALASCVQILQTAQRKIGAFRARIVGAVGAAAWRQYWSVAAWGILGGKTEVQNLRARLFEQLDVIRVYLAVSQCNDQAVLHDAMELQRASVDRLFGVMQDIQARFDVGVPSFLFQGSHRRRYFVYQPCARTSAQRFDDFCAAYTGAEPGSVVGDWEVEPSENTILTTERLHGQWQLPWDICVPELVLQCLWFRESAFGEWQVLVGLPSGRLDTQRLLKTLLERRHAIGASCTCDAGSCHKRFADAIGESRLRMTLAESYAAAANEIITHMDHTDTLMTDTDSVLARLFRARPDPVYVRDRVIPQLGECEYNEDMFQLLAEAPKLSGKERQWASSFFIGSGISPLNNPYSPWFFEFAREEPDVILPSLL